MSNTVWIYLVFWCFPLLRQNFGGILRDILICVVPPGAVNDRHYLGVSLVAGLLTFYFPSAVIHRWNPILLFDAVGLALFAVSGAHKAFVYGLNPFMAILLGMLTGIDSGTAAIGSRLTQCKGSHLSPFTCVLHVDARELK